CSGDGDCGGINRKCFNGTCTAAECTSTDDCVNDPRFGQGFSCEGQICVELGSCTTREDCQALNQVCNVVSGACVDPPTVCTVDNDCVFPGTCDTASGTCSSGGCTVDAECGTDQYCNVAAGSCAPGCRMGGCEMGVCNTTTRMCEEGGDCTPAECAATNQA